MKFKVQSSYIDRKGLFATAPIKKGEPVVEWHPKEISKSEYDKLSDDEKSYVERDGNQYLQMQPPECFMNHSCEPNTKVIGRSDVAIRDIEIGEEITSDYLGQEGSDFFCNCGSNKCRGKIS